MLNISGLNEGIVLDHIQPGMSTRIFQYLGLEKLDCQVAMIRNVKSSKMGKKDIIKIEGGLDQVDLDVLGYLDHNITINIIKNGAISEKRCLSLPKRLTNVLVCKNPRCITTVERNLKQVFLLTNAEKQTYRCMYCEEMISKNL